MCWKLSGKGLGSVDEGLSLGLQLVLGALVAFKDEAATNLRHGQLPLPLPLPDGDVPAVLHQDREGIFPSLCWCGREELLGAVIQGDVIGGGGFTDCLLFIDMLGLLSSIVL